MEEERRKVLEMLAKGTITPEQANQFLELLGTAREQPNDAEHGPRETPPDWQAGKPTGSPIAALVEAFEVQQRG